MKKRFFLLWLSTWSFFATAESGMTMQTVPFKLLNPLREHEREPWGIGHSSIGNFSYSYKGKIKFDGIVTRGNFTKRPIVVVKYRNRYYFICAVTWSDGIDFYLYENDSLRSISVKELPEELLIFSFPRDLRDRDEWQNKYCMYILCELLKSDQDKFQNVLHYFLSQRDLRSFAYAPGSGHFIERLRHLVVFEIKSNLKDALFQDVRDIIWLALTEEHSEQKLWSFFFILCCLDYSKAVVFAKEFLLKYEQADKVGRLKLFDYGLKPGHPGRPTGAESIRAINRTIADFEEDLKNYKKHTADFEEWLKNRKVEKPLSLFKLLKIVLICLDNALTP